MSQSGALLLLTLFTSSAADDLREGSFLDGGASSVMQHAAIPLLEPSRVHQVRSPTAPCVRLRQAARLQDRIALQKHFKMKRDVVLEVRTLFYRHTPAAESLAAPQRDGLDRQEPAFLVSLSASTRLGLTSEQDLLHLARPLFASRTDRARSYSPCSVAPPSQFTE